MNGGHLVPPHQNGIPCVTRPRVRLRDEKPCRYNHAQQLEHINRQLFVPVSNRCTQPRSHIVVKLKTLPHTGPELGAQKKYSPLASPEASDHKVNVGGCEKLRYKGAERRPAGDPNPPVTNRRQNDTLAWNSGPKGIRGDDAAHVCDAWYFALHVRTGGKLTWLIIRRTKYFPGRTTSHKCNIQTRVLLPTVRYLVGTPP